MKKVYIHIGTDKTGSTAIQQFLKNNHQNLLQNGYSFLTGKFAHHGFLKSIVKAKDLQNINSFKNYLKSVETEKLVISFEGFYNFNDEEISRFLGLFYGYEIIIILYLRNRLDKVRSGFAQRLKFNKQNDIAFFSKVFSNKILLRDISNEYTFKYSEIIDAWERGLESFTNSKISLGLYEKTSLLDCSLIHDFLSKLEIDKFAANMLIETHNKNEVTNPSLSVLSQLILLFFYDKGYEREELLKLKVFLQSLPFNKSDNFSLLKEENIILGSKFYEQDKMIAKRYFTRTELFLDSPKFKMAPKSYLIQQINHFVNSICLDDKVIISSKPEFFYIKEKILSQGFKKELIEFVEMLYENAPMTKKTWIQKLLS